MSRQVLFTKTPKRIIIIANRHPVTVTRNGPGDYTIKTSSGGLVTGLSGLPKTLKENSVYYGWPGIDVPEDEMAVVEQGMASHGGVAIWVDQKLMDLHYNGYSNSIVWPLFHYHANDMAFEEDLWNAYVDVNRIFATKVARAATDNDIIWVHDYHLMLAPRMIKEALAGRKDSLKNVKVGFFLHIPFPSSSEFAKLPYREHILEGLLASDLIGFHTYDYARHFLSACQKLLNLTTTPSSVSYQNRTVHVGAFPIGINPDKEREAMKQESVKSRMRDLKRSTFRDKKVIISVDRLDYIKGLPHKFHAFDMFLEKYPEQIGKVCLLQIVVPSRQDVKEYQMLHSHISELAGRINAKYGSIDYQPIVYKHKSIPHDELVALYGMSDVCLVTSTRDGMNLVSYEYIACHTETFGQLIVSEFAGAAQSMKGCLVINPWDTGDVVEGLRKALRFDENQRRENWHKMWDYVNRYTSANWGISFVDEISRIGEFSHSNVHTLSEEDENEGCFDGIINELDRKDATFATEGTLSETSVDKTEQDEDPASPKSPQIALSGNDCV